MDSSAPRLLLLDIGDDDCRSLVAKALSSMGLPCVEAPALGSGEALDALMRERGYDILLIDDLRWDFLGPLLPHGPRPYAVVVLLPLEREREAPKLIAVGAFDCVPRGAPGWEQRAAGYLRALSGLRGRFKDSFDVLERRYEDLVNSLPDIVYELDAEGRFTFVNDSVGLLGYAPGDLVGKHFSVLLYEEDARAVDRATVLELFKGVATGPGLSPKLFNERRGIDRRTENLEVRLRRKPGTRVPEGDMIASVLSYGEISAVGEYDSSRGEGFLGTVGVIRDITLRRRSEEMLRDLYQAVDQLSAGILVADRSFSVQYVNPVFFRISRRSPQEVIGADAFSFFDLTPARAEELRTQVREGFGVHEEARIRPPSSEGGEAEGENAWAELHASPVRSPSGAVTHSILICEDVSRRKSMEALVELSKQEAERANLAKSDFLASMSHELKSPVAAILAAARLIEMGGAEPERRAISIIASAQGLLDMLGDILDFVRFETGSGSLRQYVFPLPSFVERVCGPFRAAAADKGLSFSIGQVPEETVRSDPDRLGRSFAALLDNAVSFTERGSIRVECSIERKSGNVPYLALTVSDTGAGIAPEDQGRIFSAFVQLASPYSKRGGAGIGLSLARNIVRALGGEVRLQSEPGRGSTFSILVPAGEPNEPERGSSRGGRTYRILVVDDNEVNLEYMATLLENAGHRADTASSGAEALGALERRPPDAALLDIQMPGMSGIELGRRIRSYTGDRFDPRIPLTALTAFDPEEVQRSGVDFDAVFTKPADIPKLIAAVDAAVDAKEAEWAVAVRPSAQIRTGSGPLPPAAIIAAGAALARAEAELPGLGTALRRALDSGGAEPFRAAARSLAAAFGILGATKIESALHRLALAFPGEDKAIMESRINRIEAAWRRARSGSA